MSATKDDVAALEVLAYRIRQDTYGMTPWDRHGTHRVFQEYLFGMHLLTAIEIVIRHASDPEAKTPGSIKRPFNPEPAKDMPWRDIPANEREYCSVHRDNPPPPYCPACATESASAWYDPKTRQPLPPGVVGADAARIALGLPPKNQEVTDEPA